MLSVLTCVGVFCEACADRPEAYSVVCTACRSSNEWMVVEVQQKNKASCMQSPAEPLHSKYATAVLSSMVNKLTWPWSFQQALYEPQRSLDSLGLWEHVQAEQQDTAAAAATALNTPEASSLPSGLHATRSTSDV